MYLTQWVEFIFTMNIPIYMHTGYVCNVVAKKGKEMCFDNQ